MLRKENKDMKRKLHLMKKHLDSVTRSHKLLEQKMIASTVVESVNETSR